MRKIIAASVSLLTGLGLVTAITMTGAPAAQASAKELCNSNNECLVNNGGDNQVSYAEYPGGTAWAETSSGTLVTGSGQCAWDAGVGAYLLVEKCASGELEEVFSFDGTLILSDEATVNAGNSQCLITEGNGGIGNFACSARPAAEWVLKSS
jgi:hypothetical protein